MKIFKHTGVKFSEEFDERDYLQAQAIIKKSLERIERHFGGKILLMDKNRDVLEAQLDFKGIDALLVVNNYLLAVSFKVWDYYARDSPPTCASLFIKPNDSVSRILKIGIEKSLRRGVIVPAFIINIFSNNGKILFISIADFIDFLYRIETGKVKGKEMKNGHIKYLNHDIKLI